MLLFWSSSGLKQVKWKLGTEPNTADIGNGALPTVNIKENVINLSFYTAIGNVMILNNNIVRIHKLIL